MAPSAAPSTLEAVEAHALRQPAAAALQEGPLRLDYAGLDRLLRNCAAAFHRLGIRQGHKVAVGGPGFARQLVALLACESLGAATASFAGEGDADAPELFALVDWAMAAVPQAVPPARFLLLDEAFFGPMLANDAPPERPRGELGQAALQRITRTSGSSGKSKFIALSRQAQEAWVHGMLDQSPYTPASRLLITGPLILNAALARASRCLRNGGMVMAGGGPPLTELAPTDIWGLPLHLERLLDEAPAGYRNPWPATVTAVGGVLRPALRERIERAFGGRVLNRYGSNEAGSICFDMDARGIGLLSPGVQVRILDPQGADLPAGAYGAIALRTPSLADGYLGQPAAANAVFLGGWFHSADVGAIVGHRRLHLLGRQDEVVNIAGIKVPAAQVEGELRKLPALADCAALAVLLEGGAVSLGLAVVLAPGATGEQAAAQLREGLGRLAGTGAQARVLFVDAVPVMPGGKVDRMALLRLFEATAP